MCYSVKLRYLHPNERMANRALFMLNVTHFVLTFHNEFATKGVTDFNTCDVRAGLHLFGKWYFYILR